MNSSFFDNEHDEDRNEDSGSFFLTDEDSENKFRTRREVRNSQKRNSKSRFKKLLVFCIALFLFVASILPIYNLSFTQNILDRFAPNFVAMFEKDYPGPGENNIIIEIPKGATGISIGEQLYEKGIIGSPRLFANIYRREDGNKIQSGSFLLRSRMNVREAFEELLPPDLTGHINVTVPEGAVQEEIFLFLSSHLGISVQDFYTAASDISIYDLPAEATNLDGYLMPLTYTFDPENISAESVLMRLVAATKKTLNDVGVPEEYWHRILTVGSILVRETLVKDFPAVARIIYNRLDENINFETNGLLQVDSTVCYANQTCATGRVTTTPEEREIDSPYNTYLYPGLPPGPIASVTKAAIEGAFFPDVNDYRYLYWVTVDPYTGETLFARNFEEHTKNKALFYQWCKDHPGGQSSCG